MLTVATVGAVALAFVGFNRPPAWDEAVYLSNLWPSVPDIHMGPQRSWGIVAVLAPVGLWEASLTLTRAYIAGVTIAGVALAFYPWRAVLGKGGTVGAALFLFSWPGALLATHWYPNYLSGVAIVGAAGAMIAAAHFRTRGWLGLAAAMAAAGGLIRPVDAVLALAAAAFVAFIVYRREASGPVIATAVGGFVGCLYWLYDSFQRFDGPLDRVGGRGLFAATGPDETLVEYLDLIARDVDMVGATFVAYSWLVVVAVAVVASFAIRDTNRSAVATAIVSGAVILSFYVTGVTAVHVRYLLPGLALVSVAAGPSIAAAWTHLWQRGTVPMVGMLIAVAGMAAAQLSLAGAVAEDEEEFRRPAWNRGLEMGAALGGQPCAFASEWAYPQMQLASGCEGMRVDPSDPHDHAWQWLKDRLNEGVPVAVVIGADPADGEVAGWDSFTIEGYAVYVGRP